MIPAPALEIAVLIFGMAILMLEAFAPRFEKRTLAYIAIGSLAAVLVATWFVKTTPPPENATGFWAFYTADALSIFFKRFALITSIVILIMMLDYTPIVRAEAIGRPPLAELFALPLFTCAGLMYLVSAIDFVMIFVSLELVTISFYILVSFRRRNAATLEAGAKYLVLSAASTAFLVYGVAWVFGATGETNLQRITDALSTTDVSQDAALFGAVLVLVALGFKIAAVPFQIWVPDVYQGAPTPTTAFLSVGSKAAGFVVLLRVLRPFLLLPYMQRVLVLLALLTVLYGNLAALPQNNFKRLLAYSSIAHAGYLLIGVACFDGNSVVFYLTAYLLMTLLSFAVLVIIERQNGDSLADFDGLAKRSPFLAFALLIGMLSLAGLPFTAGFFGKFFIFYAAVQQHQTALVVVGIITVACGFYYYLKVVRAMYWQTPTTNSAVPITAISRATMATLTVATVFFGIYPQPILRAIKPQSETVAANSTISR